MQNPATIIIVDDDEMNRYVLSDLVEMLEHVHVLAADGVTALNVMRKQTPDLVLLDILMPKMTGYEVLKIMKKDPELSHIPVIITSGIHEIDIVAHCIKNGAEDYVTKPYDLAKLRSKITSCLEKKKLRSQEKNCGKQKEEYELHLRIYRKQMEEYSRCADFGNSDMTDKSARRTSCEF